MIVHVIDHGWGPEWPMKKIESDIINGYLSPLKSSTKKIVVVNSTWYSQYHHAKTLRWLRDNDWDALVLVALIDAAIPQPDWFDEFDRPVLTVGGYNSKHYLSFWAEVVYQHIEPYRDHDIDTAFMCLNRKPHWHRRKFYKEMQANGILEFGLVSMGNESAGPAEREITEQVADNMLAPNGQRLHHGIPNDITSLGDLSNWRRHFLNVVTETVYDINRNHFVSEKIFKPIVGCRPFLVYDTDGACDWLTRSGFQSYVNDFTDITDLDLKSPSNLAPFLKTLCQQDPKYWRQKYIDLLPKINYNLERFKMFVNQQRDQITQGIQCQI